MILYYSRAMHVFGKPETITVIKLLLGDFRHEITLCGTSAFIMDLSTSSPRGSSTSNFTIPLHCLLESLFVLSFSHFRNRWKGAHTVRKNFVFLYDSHATRCVLSDAAIHFTSGLIMTNIEENSNFEGDSAVSL